MDSCEATRIVFSRIQSLDSENASKIMGLLLIQDHGEKEMIRLAFGPETLVHSVILKARKDLGLLSNSPSTPSTPSSPSPFLPSNPINISGQNSSSRLGINLPSSITIPSPSSSISATWTAFSEHQNPDDLISPSTLPVGASCSPMDSSALPFFGSSGADMIDEFQLQEQLSFLNDGTPLDNKNPDLFYQQSLSSSPTGGVGSEAMLFSSHGTGSGWGGSGIHRRSFSVSDACMTSEDPNCVLGWKPCLYYARGYCKNGSSCRFLHGGLGESGAASLVSSDMAAIIGSPNKMEMMDQCHEIFRSKPSVQQQRIAAASQLMASSNSIPYSSKCMNYLLQQPSNDNQRVAAALMMGEDLQKFGRARVERSDYMINGGLGMVNPASRQIYLTFPADSTFREEDVSNYFSIYGPVQDVRIPYQQKRMFGFVTFVYPETVKLILAKGNPHFVCDARVLVKPYKEKGKVPDKYRKQQQQIERGDFSPTGLDSRDPFDFQLGARLSYNTQEMLWRKKMEEQADLQQALELQTRRLMGLQLLEMKKHHHHHRALSTGSPVPSPTQSPNPFGQTLVFSPILNTSPDLNALENASAGALPTVPVGLSVHQIVKNNDMSSNYTNGDCNKDTALVEESYILESLEHYLPDSPFASPTKAAGFASSFLTPASEVVGSVSSDMAANSSNLQTSSDLASFKSYNCQMPRFCLLQPLILNHLFTGRENLCLTNSTGFPQPLAPADQLARSESSSGKSLYNKTKENM